MPPSPQNLFDSGIVRNEKVVVDVDISSAPELRLLIVDADSYDRSRVIASWSDAKLAGPAGATPLPGTTNLRVPSELVFPLTGKGYTRFQATLLVDKTSQQSDINPRVRFFVFDQPPDPERLVRQASGLSGQARGLSYIYQHTYARNPTPKELSIAQEFLASGPEGLEDLLWTLFLSPEFLYLH